MWLLAARDEVRAQHCRRLDVVRERERVMMSRWGKGGLRSEEREERKREREAGLPVDRGGPEDGCTVGLQTEFSAQ
jgi:hypothetical protein